MKSNKGSVHLEIPPMKLETIDVVIVGDTPLICHKFSKKAQDQMLAKHMGKAQVGRELKNPQRDFEESLYVMEDGRYGFPVIAFKNAAVSACTSMSGITKVAARQCFRVGNTLNGRELVPIYGDEPKMRQDMVRVGQGKPDVRFRGEFVNWWTVLRITYNAGLLSQEQIATLLQTAGFAVGIGEWRTEKDGQNGAFHVATEAEAGALLKTLNLRGAKLKNGKRRARALAAA